MKYIDIMPVPFVCISVWGLGVPNGSGLGFYSHNAVYVVHCEGVTAKAMKKGQLK